MPDPIPTLRSRGPGAVSAAARIARSAHLATLRQLGRVAERGQPSHHAGQELRILADVPAYVPSTLAGSEKSLHSVLGWLATKGHEIQVVLPGTVRPDRIDGVSVTSQGHRSDLRRAYLWADVVVTQLGRRNDAIRMAARTARPLVHFLRMGGADPRAVFGRPELVVFNAAWISERFPWPGASAVLASPVFAEDYRVESNRTAVTLIGLSELKGAKTFYELARRRPDLSFLGVRGAWGDQLAPEEAPPNLTVVETTPDIREIYRQTRVLVMPSSSEALPRTAREAAASGIPTIAHPAPGLVEVLGDDGLYADRADIGAWEQTLRDLDDPGNYDDAVAGARAVSARWDPAEDLAGFETILRSMIAKHAAK